MPDRRVLNLAAGLDRAHDYFSRVDANASFERRPSLGGEMLTLFAQLLLHLEGGIEGALWMVLVGGRGAEQREDAIAGGLHQVSRPGESHPQALAEPYRNVSVHTAPIIQPS